MKATRLNKMKEQDNGGLPGLLRRSLRCRNVFYFAPKLLEDGMKVTERGKMKVIYRLLIGQLSYRRIKCMARIHYILCNRHTSMNKS